MSKRQPIVVMLGEFETELMTGLNKEGIKVRFFNDFESYDDIDGDILLVDKNFEKQAMSILKMKTMVPVVYVENKFFVEFEPNREVGFAFVYNDDHYLSQFAAVIRACETFKFPFDWKGLMAEVKAVSKRFTFDTKD